MEKINIRNTNEMSLNYYALDRTNQQRQLLTV